MGNGFKRSPRIWGSGHGERRRHVEELLKRFSRRHCILMGDLNEWFLWGRPLRWLHRHFRRTPAPATFPSGWPLLALDRIWVEPNRALRTVRAHRSTAADIASDHLPLTATVRLDPGEGADTGTPA